MRALALGVLLALLPGIPRAAEAQPRPDLALAWEDGSTGVVPLRTERGFAAVPVDALTGLGWSVGQEGDDVVARGPRGSEIVLRAGSPFLRWDGEVLQMVEAPYREEGVLLVPAQLLTDFLPRRLSDLYAFHGPRLLLESATGGPRESGGPPEAPARVQPEASVPVADEAPGPVDTMAYRPPSEYEGVRVVVIDAGHGGKDPGSIARSGLQEKVVALAVARAVARRLEGEPGIEVRMIRDDDTFVDLWERGPMATEMKGDRPGVLLSIHANSFSNSARGFETYFLSEARTEHERRVAAIENAPLPLDEGESEAGGDLGFILRELRNLDHQHWSAFLAELIQEEVDVVHPGPNRGVKQAPLAVITNALMPSVLVEIGYLSHPGEAALLSRSDFQESAGEAIAQAVLRFFERYPPGSWSRTGGR